MSTFSKEDKKELISRCDESFAGQLARLIIDKPVPTVWMILVPILFVLYAWKIREYSNGLKMFSENFLISRKRALDAAFESQESGTKADIGQLVEMADDVPAQSRELYRNWLQVLVDHYGSLLTSRGRTYPELIQSCYKDKTAYLLFCNKLNTTENSFNNSLLSEIEGEFDELRDVLTKMTKVVEDLRREKAEEIFS